MEIITVSAREYDQYFKTPYHIFVSGAFNELNADKCEEIFYLLFKDKKVRLGIIAGIKENNLYSPFSAPFGGFSFIKEDIRLQHIELAVDLLNIWSEDKGLKSIQITLPPTFYHRSFISKLINVLYRKYFTILSSDLNYAFDLKNFDGDYMNRIWRNARKNLKRSLDQALKFVLAVTEEEKQLAYHVIKVNRESKGFPLRMTWKQVKKTIEYIPADFFLVSKNEVIIASAMVFHISDTIVQVVYWGDLPDYSSLKTMNFLSFKIFEYYKTTDIKIIDIGPSTENSIPNYGLCEFKESIGCDIVSKISFAKELI